MGVLTLIRERDPKFRQGLRRGWNTREVAGECQVGRSFCRSSPGVLGTDEGGSLETKVRKRYDFPSSLR